MTSAGVVVALGVEAKTLGSCVRRTDGLATLSDGCLVAVSGVGGPAAANAARALIAAGAKSLVSWGLAGGLDPTLPAGTICLPQSVVADGGASFDTEPHWREIMTSCIAPRRTVVGGLLFTSAEPIIAVAAKAAAFRDTGALAVDMESLAVAQIAAGHGLPFLAVRVIVDTAGDALPTAVTAASGSDGRVHVGRLLLGIVRMPRDLPAVLRLARRYRIATQVLAEVARTGALAPLALGKSSASRIA